MARSKLPNGVFLAGEDIPMLGWVFKKPDGKLYTVKTAAERPSAFAIAVESYRKGDKLTTDEATGTQLIRYEDE